MTRIPEAPIDGPDADRVNVARIAELRDGRVSTLYRTLLHSGEVASGWCALGTAVRYGSSLDDRLRELVICQVAGVTEATYEWRHHEPLARAAGVTADQLASLPTWRGCVSFSDRDTAALQLADAVLVGAVDDEVFAAASAAFDRQELVEIVATSAYYLAVSRFLQAAGVDGAPAEGDSPR